MSINSSFNSVKKTILNPEIVYETPSDKLLSSTIPLKEASLQRFNELNALELSSDSGASDTKKPFRFDTFLDNLINRFLNIGIIPIEHYFYGTAATHICYNRKYNDIDITIKIREDANLTRVLPAIEYVLKYLGCENDLIETCQPSPDGNSITITLATCPKKVDIVVLKEKSKKEIDSSTKILCDSSMTCFQIVTEDNHTFIRTVADYDAQEAEQLLEENQFTVKPLSAAKVMNHGLFRYCKLLMKGVLANNKEIEANFCVGFANKYIHPEYDDGQAHLASGIWKFIVKFSQSEAQAFLFTLDTILSRSTLTNKETYCAIVHTFIPNWDQEKKIFFLKHCKSSCVKIESTAQPPLYRLNTSETCFLIEPPSSAIEDLLAKNTKENALLALDLMEEMRDPSPQLLEKGVRVGITYGLHQRAYAMFYKNIATLFRLTKNQLLSLAQGFPKTRYVNLVKLLLNQNFSGYIHALEAYLQGRGLEGKREQETLLKLAGTALQLNHDDIIENLLASSDLHWLLVGFKRASCERIVRYVLEEEISQESIEPLIEKILTSKTLDSILLIKCCEKLKWDKRLNPLIKSEIKEAIEKKEDNLAIRLLEKGDFLPEEKLFFALQIKTENGSDLCYEIVQSSNSSNKEKVFFHLLESGLFEKALNLIDEVSAPKLITALTSRHTFKGAALISDVLLTTALSKNITLSERSLLDGIQQLARASMYSRIFFYLRSYPTIFKKMPLKYRLELLRSLEELASIALLLESFKGDKFQHEKYLDLLENNPKILEEKNLQEELLEFIGEPLSLDNLNKLYLEKSPIWRKTGIARLSNEQFLEYILTDLEISKPVLDRFKTLCNETPEKCAPAYLKLSSKELLKEGDKIMKALPAKAPLKQEILELFFDQHTGNDKKSKEELSHLLNITKKYCILDNSLCSTAAEQLFKKLAAKETFSKNLFSATSELINVLEGPNRSDLMTLLIRKAVKSSLLECAQAYFEEQFEEFLALSGKQLDYALKKIKLSAKHELLLFKRALQEQDTNIKPALLTCSFENLLKNPSFEVASFCYETFINNRFFENQIIQNTKHFLRIRLEKSSEIFSADIIFNYFLPIVKAVPEHKLDSDLKKFILENWNQFENAPLFQCDAINDVEFYRKIAAMVKQYSTTHANAIENLEKDSESLHLTLPEDLLSAFKIVSPEIVMAAENSTHDLLKLYAFLKLMDNSTSFDVSYFFLQLLKIAVLTKFEQTFLFELDLDRVFHEGFRESWKQDENSIAAVTHMTLKTINERLTTSCNIKKARNTLIKGTMVGALSIEFILEAQEKINGHLTLEEQIAFNQDILKALKTGEYRIKDH
jgi:hypothetical protein